MNGPFERRTRAVREELRRVGASAVILGPGPNLVYLTQLDEDPSERYFLFIVPADDPPRLFVPAMAEPAVRANSWVETVVTYTDEDSPRSRLRTELDAVGVEDGYLLVDDHLWTQVTLALQSIRPKCTFGLASDILADLRIRKDESELEAMLAATAITDAVCRGLRTHGDVVSRSEADIARRIEDEQRSRGGAGAAFETIVAAGPNGAEPHHGHGDRVIEAGDPVVLDFGTVLDGYASDQTRTMVFGGPPPDGFEDVFDAVLAAHNAGIEAVEPGVSCATVDHAARSVLEERGYGKAFVHRTGHGVGLEIHEPPYIVAGNERELEPGMVFSIEPGVYFEGRFGVRIEDLVVVTDDGCDRLNDSPRTWQVG